MSVPESEILICQPEDGRTRIHVRMEGESVWLTQKHMAELFQVSVPTINEHIQNAYKEREIEPEATVRKFRIVQTEGRREVTRDISHYNLDVIIAVGYRVRSHRGTQFRRWATERLFRALAPCFCLAKCNKTRYSSYSKPAGPLTRASAARSLRRAFPFSGACHAI